MVVTLSNQIPPEFDRPNYAFAAPRSLYADVSPELDAPVFQISGPELFEKCISVWGDQDRTELIKREDAHLRAHFVCTTRFLHFKDDIFIEIVPIGEHSFSVLVLSKSRVGYLPTLTSY